jgi:CRISPR-associated protein Cst1
MDNDYITLYPSNWLYNAGVLGFIKSLKDYPDFSEFTNEPEIFNVPISGEIVIQKKVFETLNVEKRYFDEQKLISIIGKNKYYKNYLQSNQKELFKEFVRSLKNHLTTSNCQLCNEGKYLEKDEIERLNLLDPSDKKFLNRIQSFNMVHNSELGPSSGEFPNGFWNCKQSTKICHLCSFLIIHQHLAISQLSNKSDIFINAPSFKLMYDLNNFATQVFSYQNSSDERSKREILALSIIEYTLKAKSMLSAWSNMNLEIVNKYRLKRDNKWIEKIEFFSLPYDVIQIITNRYVAAQLSDIGEFRILNFVLDKAYSKLIELGYRLLNLSTKETADRRNKADDSFINDWLFQYKNKKDLGNTANKILKLYALIEEQTKRSQIHGSTNTIHV